MLKYCEICGKAFNATGTAKYCSAACRQEAQHRNRKAWEERTGYKDRRRIEAQEYQQGLVDAAEKEAELDKKRQERNRKRREAYRKKKDTERLQAAAASGDALARMKIAERFSYDYWEAYKQYELEIAERSGRECRATVNGISVNDDDFALKVVISIDDLGSITTAAN